MKSERGSLPLYILTAVLALALAGSLFYIEAERRISVATDIQGASSTQDEINDLRQQVEQLRNSASSTSSSASQTTIITKVTQVPSQSNAVSPSSDARDSDSGGLTNAILNKIMARLVEVDCRGDGVDVKGSGSMGLIQNGSPSIVTNFHVIGLTGGGVNSFCTINIPHAPDYDYTRGTPYVAKVGKFDGHYPDIDAAVLQIADVAPGDLASFDVFPVPFCNESKVQIGDKVTLIGYPGLGGSSITVTDGIISGYLHTQYGTVYKTSAMMDHGISGGLAVRNSGPCVLGIPTWLLADAENAASLGVIQSWGSIKSSGQIF